ncbi:MAG: carbon storage regulator CsrA [Acidobacteria bacterium]|nr:carbon storage regulator CsrA [Acidobacteriota bacterium]MDA1234852.1 carbon storage regulator CsrA [Acidobacteriota bacterium]
MLVLSRQAGESVRIGENIEITVLDVRAGAVKIGIDAPRSVLIFRSELEQINLQAAAGSQDKVQLTAIAQKLRRITDTP